MLQNNQLLTQFFTFFLPLQISIIAISVLKVFISTFCICFTVRDSSKRFQIIEAGIKNFIHSFFCRFFANFSNSQNGTNCSVSYTSLKWELDKEKSVSINNFFSRFFQVLIPTTYAIILYHRRVKQCL